MLALAFDLNLLNAAISVVLLLLLLGLHHRLGRIESRLAQPKTDPRKGNSSTSSGTHSDEDEGPYEQFLAEDPQRLGLSKSEQFAAYREWRKERGLNWSEPSS